MLTQRGLRCHLCALFVQLVTWLSFPKKCWHPSESWLTDACWNTLGIAALQKDKVCAKHAPLREQLGKLDASLRLLLVSGLREGKSPFCVSLLAKHQRCFTIDFRSINRLSTRDIGGIVFPLRLLSSSLSLQGRGGCVNTHFAPGLDCHGLVPLSFHPPQWASAVTTKSGKYLEAIAYPLF